LGRESSHVRSRLGVQFCCGISNETDGLTVMKKFHTTLAMQSTKEVLLSSEM